MFESIAMLAGVMMVFGAAVRGARAGPEIGSCSGAMMRFCSRNFYDAWGHRDCGGTGTNGLVVA